MKTKFKVLSLVVLIHTLSPLIFKGSGGELFAQDQLAKYKYDNMLWMGYYNSVKINDKWSLNSDLQYRTKDWYKTPLQALARIGLNYKINSRLNVTAGLAHFRFYLNDVVTRGEWRPWEEVALSDRIGKVKLNNRLRVEQRFNEGVASGEPNGIFKFNWRFRYRFDIQYPAESKISLVVGNEVMINTGKNISNNYFDQNRTWAGVNTEITKKFSVQLQFMYIWQLMSNGYTLDKINVVRFNVYHKINLK